MENNEKNHKQDLEIIEIKTNLKNLDGKFSHFMGNDFKHLKIVVDDIKDTVSKTPDWKLITALFSAIGALLTVIGFLIIL